MRKPTISAIKEATKKKSPYFFSRDTLKHFGQTMASFKVAVSPKGNVFIYAKGYDTDRGVRRFMGFTFRQFKDGDLKNIPGTQRTIDEVRDYISTH